MINLLRVIRRLLGFEPKKVNLSGIFLAEKAGLPMCACLSAEAVVNKGLKGDRYYNDTGYWHRVESCQVTLISAFDLALASKGNSFDLSKGSHRRNLVISGIKTKALEGKVFRIGKATFKYTKPRPPCGYLDKIEGKGMALALSYNSGICLSVIQGGRIKVGDVVEIIEVL